jgi:phenylpropionate dioxygenase-like ring-hydroxylating dioxygenase large terminal subunit
MILAEGRGQCREIVCPYHAWTYDLDGQLLGAGQMRQSAGFDPRHFRLPELRCEIWQGWIYVTLDSALPSLAGALAPLAGVVDRYAMAEYVPVIQQDQVWQTNWKLLNENFMEGYHGPVVHRTTVGAGVAVADTEFPEPRGEAFTYSTFTKPETARYGRAHPDNRRLQGRWRYTAVLPTVFPCHSFSLSPDYLWYLSLRPRGPGEVAVRIGVSIAPENHAAETDLPGYIRTLEGFFDQVNAEDRMTVEGLYRGIQAPLATGGPLSWLERELHDFIRYLARRLVPEDGGAP